MNIIPWRPRPELSVLRHDMADLVRRVMEGEGLGRHLPEALRGGGFPRVNVAETEEHVEITAELPGMAPQDIDVQLLGHKLVISGERRWEEEQTSREFHRVEREYGSFRREIPLPEGLELDAGRIDARYGKGVLTVILPKRQPSPVSRIPVHAEGPAS